MVIKEKLPKGKNAFLTHLIGVQSKEILKNVAKTAFGKIPKKNKISKAKRRKLFHRISLPISGFKHIFTAYTLAIFQRIFLTSLIPTYKKIENPASTLLKI